MKKDRCDLNEYITSDIRIITTKYITALQLKMRDINLESNNKGIGQSGVLVTIQDKNFYSSLDSLIKELIESVEIKQGKLNIKYEEEELIKAEEVLKQCALNYNCFYYNERDKLMERLGFNHINEDLFKNMGSTNIVGEIENEFKRLKLNLKLIKDTPEVRGQKKSNAIGFATLIFTIMTLAVSVLGVYLAIKSK